MVFTGFRCSIGFLAVIDRKACNTGISIFTLHTMRWSQLAKAGLMPCPLDAQIHVGTGDWQSVFDNVLAIGKALAISVHLSGGRGHLLGEDYVRPLIDAWLQKSQD